MAADADAVERALKVAQDVSGSVAELVANYSCKKVTEFQACTWRAGGSPGVCGFAYSHAGVAQALGDLLSTPVKVTPSRFSAEKALALARTVVLATEGTWHLQPAGSLRIPRAAGVPYEDLHPVYADMVQVAAAAQALVYKRAPDMFSGAVGTIGHAPWLLADELELNLALVVLERACGHGDCWWALPSQRDGIMAHALARAEAAAAGCANVALVAAAREVVRHVLVRCPRAVSPGV